MGRFDDGFRFGLGLGCFLGFLAIAGPVFYIVATTPWLKCFLSGSAVSSLHILGMRLRGTPVNVITDAHIALVHSGLQIDIRRVESAYLSQPNRVATADQLVDLVKWGLYEANPKPPWAIDATSLVLGDPVSANTKI
jgi:hypothetical protein